MSRIQIIGVLILTLAVMASETARADWKIYYRGQYAKWFGAGGRGSFATQQEAEAYRTSRPSGEASASYSAGFDTPTYKPPAQNEGASQAQAAADQAAYQEKLKKQEEEAKRIEEAKNLQALQRWEAMQKDANAEKLAKAREGKLLLASLDSNGADPGGGELKPMPAEGYAAPSSPLEQLQAAAGFSLKALDAAMKGDAEGARDLSEQAAFVMPGQPTDQSSGLQPMPEVPDASPAVRTDKQSEYISTIKKDIQRLQDLEIKVQQAGEQKKVAQEKKHQAQDMVVKAKELRVSSKPEEKAKASGLEKEAKALEEAANQQEAEADKSIKDYQNEKDGIQDELNQIDAAVKNPEQ